MQVAEADKQLWESCQADNYKQNDENWKELNWAVRHGINIYT